MLPAIDFDDDPFCKTDEVYDIAADRSLPAKVKSPRTQGPEVKP